MTRTPTDPRRLADLIRAVYAAEGADAEEQTAKDLLDALLVQGCLTPAEHGEAFLEDVQPDDFVDVRVDGLGWLRIGLDGAVEVLPE